MRNIKLTSLGNFLSEKHFILLVGIGFDQRSMCAIDNIDLNMPQITIGILNPIRPGTPQTNYHSIFLEKTKKNSELIGLNSHSLIATIDQLQERLLAPELTQLEIVLDVTSLSHELLVAIIGLLASEELFNKTTIIYTGASDYSFNTDHSSKWLSRGVSDIRSVLGFPGMMLPSRKLHLIVMAGFEADRAIEVISRYEPTRLSIGYGSKEDSIHIEHHKKNKDFADEIESYVVENELIEEHPILFEFSCINPLKTKSALIEHIKKFPHDNIVICAMNNKISTIGAALAALDDSRLQICYAQPQEYNIAGYAIAGDEVTVINLLPTLSPD